MDIPNFIYTGTTYASYAVGGLGLWLIVKAFGTGTDIKKVIQRVFGILILLGGYPYLFGSLPTVGEALAKPLVSIIVDASNGISKDISK